MSTTHGTIAGMERGRTQFAKNKAELIVQLPEPGTVYRWRDVDLTQAQQQILRYEHVINPVGKIDGGRHKAIKWETNRRPYETAQHYIESGNTFPCGHASGFRTVDADAGVYECGFDGCSETYDRETVEEVMW